MSLQLSAPFDSIAAIVDVVPIGLALLNGEGRVRWSNAEFTRLVGRSRDECFDRPFVELVGQVSGVDGVQTEARLTSRDGQPVVLEISGGPLAEGERGDS